jgi:hypothetical protein
VTYFLKEDSCLASLDTFFIAVNGRIVIMERMGRAFKALSPFMWKKSQKNLAEEVACGPRIEYVMC